MYGVRKFFRKIGTASHSRNSSSKWDLIGVYSVIVPIEFLVENAGSHNVRVSTIVLQGLYIKVLDLFYYTIYILHGTYKYYHSNIVLTIWCFTKIFRIELIKWTHILLSVDHRIRFCFIYHPILKQCKINSIFSILSQLLHILLKHWYQKNSNSKNKGQTSYYNRIHYSNFIILYLSFKARFWLMFFHITFPTKCKNM